jgi:hypothetical protein
VYQGERVDLDTITRPGVRGRVEAALQPVQLGHLVLQRVLGRQPVNLEMLQKNYPDAYALYSQRFELTLRQAAWVREREQRAKHNAFCAAN